MKTLTITILGFLFLAACTFVDKPVTDEEKEQIKMEVTQIFNHLLDEMEALNFEGFVNYNQFDEKYSTIMDGVISIGGDVAKEMFKGSFEYIKEFLYADMTETHFDVLDRNVVQVMGSFDEAYVTMTGDTLKVKGTGSYIFKLFETDWKLIHLSAWHHAVE